MNLKILKVFIQLIVLFPELFSRFSKYFIYFVDGIKNIYKENMTYIACCFFKNQTEWTVTNT
uniref:Uncharacterized protein n=1 Tax=Schistosoma mansoni TaxID=6183 RepID=A0A5K4F7C0_SCHMA